MFFFIHIPTLEHIILLTIYIVDMYDLNKNAVNKNTSKAPVVSTKDCTHDFSNPDVHVLVDFTLSITTKPKSPSNFACEQFTQNLLRC